MRKVIPFTKKAFVEAFSKQLQMRCAAFAEIAPNRREYTESIKPLIESADLMFTAHFINEDTYAECRQLYDAVCKKIEALLIDTDSNNKLVLTYAGMDSWDRPVYTNGNRLFVDVEPRKNKKAQLCTVLDNCFGGEPDTPIHHIQKYKDLEIEFLPKRVTW